MPRIFNQPSYLFVFGFVIAAISGCREHTTPTEGSARPFDTVTAAAPQGSVIPAGYLVSDSVGSQTTDGTPYSIMLLQPLDSMADRMLMIVRHGEVWAASSRIAGPYYNEASYKCYDTEDLSAEGDTIKFVQYGTGPYGNRDFNFVWNGKDWQLHRLETYNMGAGGHTAMEFNGGEGKATITEINTMKEDMPSESTDYNYHKNDPVPFDKFDADTFIYRMFRLETQAELSKE